MNRLMLGVAIVCVWAVRLAQTSAQEQEMAASERARHAELESLPLHQLRNVDLADYLQLETKTLGKGAVVPHAREKAGLFARRSVGLPYRLFAVQGDLGEGDCISFVNRMIALSVSSNWQSYAIITERLRHNEGIVEYRNRNFFTLGDWVPNNAWLLEDVTSTLGSVNDPPSRYFTYVVQPKLFDERPAAPGSRFTRIVFKGADKSVPGELRQDSFIPSEKLAEVASYLQTGDVALVIRPVKGGHWDCDHVGLIVMEGNVPNLLHCAPPHAFQEPIDTFLTRCKWVSGMKFLRLRDQAKEIAAEEAARLASVIPVSSPADQDAKNAQLRARRLATAATQPSR